MSIRKRTWKSRGVEQTAWVVDYVDQVGKRRLRTFKTKKQADSWSVTAQHEISQGVHTPVSASTMVREAFDLWLQHCGKEGLERSTIEQRERHLRLHVDPFIGRERLATLSMPRIYTFDSQLRDAGRSTEMRRKVLTSIKTMLAFAQGRGLVAQNVARGVKVKDDARRRSTGQLKEGRDFPSRAELRLLIDVAPDRWRPFVIMAIFTGMRASELRGLRWSDVDMSAGVVHVAQRADAWGRMSSPKSAAGKRDIPLTPLVLNTLRQWKVACPAGPLVFPNNAGGVGSHSSFVQWVWWPLQVGCGLTTNGKPRYPFHSLRHAAASLFIEHLRWTPKRIQVVMGHSGIAMTFDRYGHLFETTDDSEALKRLEAAVIAT
jgi:integrase